MIETFDAESYVLINEVFMWKIVTFAFMVLKNELMFKTNSLKLLSF